MSSMESIWARLIYVLLGICTRCVTVKALGCQVEGDSKATHEYNVSSSL